MMPYASATKNRFGTGDQATKKGDLIMSKPQMKPRFKPGDRMQIKGDRIVTVTEVLESKLKGSEHYWVKSENGTPFGVHMHRRELRPVK